MAFAEDADLCDVNRRIGLFLFFLVYAMERHNPPHPPQVRFRRSLGGQQ
jgi:hypothetical protein